MTDRGRSKRTQALITLFWVAALAATTTNTLEAFIDPEGSWWMALRAALSIAATVALLVLAGSWLADRRLSRRTAGHRPGQSP